jgi:hypothetical protein
MKNEHCRLADDTMTLALRKRAFEKDNLGSLLISAKGKTPDFGHNNNGQWITFTEEQQRSNGNFMTGEGLGFFETQTTIARIHEELFLKKDALIARLDALEVLFSADGQINDEIAVVGMGCVFPSGRISLIKNTVFPRYLTIDGKNPSTTTPIQRPKTSPIHRLPAW